LEVRGRKGKRIDVGGWRRKKEETVGGLRLEAKEEERD
jgi:hypothetical protein